MDGVIPSSFNPWTLLDSEDPGDRIGKAKSKEDEAKKTEPPSWKAPNRAMNTSTPAKKKKNKKKKKPAASTSNNNNPAGNGNGAAGKQNGAPKENGNGAASGSGGGGNRNQQGAARQGGYYSNNGGNYAAPTKEQQQQPRADGAEGPRPEQERASVPLPTFGLWLDKSTKKAGPPTVEPRPPTVPPSIRDAATSPGSETELEPRRVLSSSRALVHGVLGYEYISLNFKDSVAYGYAFFFLLRCVPQSRIEHAAAMWYEPYNGHGEDTPAHGPLAKLRDGGAELLAIFPSNAALLSHSSASQRLTPARNPRPRDRHLAKHQAITMSTAAEVETIGGGGGDAAAPVVVVERVVTVEYLEPSMSRGLLGKFPDSSAFDFDYSQSGIWSPLNKHPRAAPGYADDAAAASSTDFLVANPKRKARASGCRIKESFGCGGGGKSRWRRRRLRRDGSFLDLHDAGRTKLDFAPPSPSPAKEGWRRVLKAAITKFKARQRRSRKAPLLQMILPMM
ncbi:hypothetical protein EJB05_38839, partial [Eragrostis curvula]